MARILTIVLNYRTPEMTLGAVEAALREMQTLDGEIVIVDNDSGDGSHEALVAGVAEKGWDIRVLQSGRNGGFGAGNNFGIRAGMSDGSKPDYYYILNSDAFPDEGSICILLQYLEKHRDVGFAGSYIHGPERDTHVTAFRFPSIQSEFEGSARFGPVTRMLADHVVPLPVPEQAQAVDWLAGASMMMRAEVLEEIGLFDETFFLYFEETDLCRRAKLAGWPTHYVRDSRVTHIGSVSTGMKEWNRVPEYWFDSRWHYFVKNHGWLYAVLATFAHLTGGVIHRARVLLQRKDLGDPPGFLRHLLAHDLRALLRRRKKHSNENGNALNRTSFGEGK
ncbi:glycosyltransferase family 2 protein [Alisedimentitalea sp. MJ-SS2]|uniref:glycosyltransferase family 2 protein n=1 Tax=Aliisedimentitalea sp. MJ-SS2 TaxID=3049795 RepID=UPI002907699A|nr:glycosyltransferase family 2 protein [Alisedimentitalea sp. MJ-SS2]MDU8926224.1 glycosyltransferase family 2 protein [Alisedimentitalea sp. MJ-SS2]